MSEGQSIAELERVQTQIDPIAQPAQAGFLETNHAVELGGVGLPQATAIVTLNWHAGLDEQQFATAAEFRPERWLVSPDAVARQRAAMVPFGTGPRLCPGRTLALLEIKTAVSMICRHFSISKAAAAAPVGEVFAFTLMPTGVVLRFRHRMQPA